MESTITQVLASLFNVPDWAPRAIRRAVIVILASAAILTPTYFNDAVSLWTRQYSHALMEKMQPILDSLAEPPPPPARPTGVRHHHKTANHPAASQPTE